MSKMIYHLRSEHKESYEDFEEKSAGCKELCELCSERKAAQIDQLIVQAFMKAASFGLFRTGSRGQRGSRDVRRKSM